MKEAEPRKEVASREVISRRLDLVYFLAASFVESEIPLTYYMVEIENLQGARAGVDCLNTRNPAGKGKPGFSSLGGHPKRMRPSGLIKRSGRSF